MIYAKSVLPLLVMKLLVVTAKDTIGTDCKKKKCDFGEPFEVTFKLDQAADFCCDDRWIGIFDSKEKRLTAGNAHFHSRNACGIGHNPDDYCSNKKTGTVVFDNIDPSERGNLQQWPASPGKYKICHLSYSDELIQKCGKVEVVLSKKIIKNIKKKAFVEPTKEVYEHDEDISADFDSAYAYPNTMIAIYRKDRQDYYNSVYTGCNNYWGDQRWSYDVSNECIKTQKSGMVTFTSDNSERDDPLDAGEYEMRILYLNDKFDLSTDNIADVVSATFTVNPKPVSSKSPSSKSPSSKSPSSKSPSDDD